MLVITDNNEFVELKLNKIRHNICEANISYASAYFIAKRFHSPKANFIEKSTDKVDAFCCIYWSK